MKNNVKSKPHRKKSGERRASKSAGGTHKLQSQVACIGKRSPIGFSCGIDDNEALAIEESLDQRERRG